MSGILSLEKGVGGGAIVRHASADGLSRSMNDILFLSEVPLEQLTEVRSALLTLAVRAACSRATLSDLVDLDVNISETRRAYEQGRIDEAIAHIGEFYELLGKAAHNEVLVVIISSLTSTVRSLLEQTDVVLEPEFEVGRRAIIEAIRERDEEQAEIRLRRHIGALKRFVATHHRSDVA